MPAHQISKEAAHQIISDELMLDGNPRLNLASFVTTWMEPECDRLILSALNKNYIDMDEYPVTTELQAYHYMLISNMSRNMCERFMLCNVCVYVCLGVCTYVHVYMCTGQSV